METIETERMLLRAPRLNDIQTIFDRYASDPEVTRYRHVMEKCGFQQEADLTRQAVFPNLSPDVQDVLVYSLAPLSR